MNEKTASNISVGPWNFFITGHRHGNFRTLAGNHHHIPFLSNFNRATNRFFPVHNYFHVVNTFYTLLDINNYFLRILLKDLRQSK